jgi:hypothetical protein
MVTVINGGLSDLGSRDPNIGPKVDEFGSEEVSVVLMVESGFDLAR